MIRLKASPFVLSGDLFIDYKHVLDSVWKALKAPPSSLLFFLTVPITSPLWYQFYDPSEDWWNKHDVFYFKLWFYFNYLRRPKHVCCALCSALGRQSHSLTRDTLFTLRSLAAFCARPLHLKRPRFCLRWAIEREAVGGLRCCHGEGHAPLMSEWVTQQPLPWRGKKKRHKKKCFRLMFGKCYLGFVLSVGGMMKMMAARFAFRNIWQVCSVWMLHKGVLFMYECETEKTFWLKPPPTADMLDVLHYSCIQLTKEMLLKASHYIRSLKVFFFLLSHQLLISGAVRRLYVGVYTSWKPPQHLDRVAVCVYCTDSKLSKVFL